jgi:hypothetical protein
MTPNQRLVFQLEKQLETLRKALPRESPAELKTQLQ